MLKVGIIGTGLIGGSLAANLSESQKYQVFCYNRNSETSKKALGLKICSQYFDSMSELTFNSDIIIIASPLASYVEITKQIVPEFNDSKILSEIGSVKAIPSQQIFEILGSDKSPFFVPAHPIAGSHLSGIDNIDKNLFNNKKLIISANENANKSAISTIADLWKNVGSEIEYLLPEIHDEIYAKISHFVQFLSFAIKKVIPDNVIELEGDKDIQEFFRLTNSPPEIWQEIFHFNRIHINNSKYLFLKNLKSALDKLTSKVDNENDSESIRNFSIIIADSLKKSTPNEYLSFAGSGFKSFTRILEKNSLDFACISNNTKQLIYKLIIELENS